MQFVHFLNLEYFILLIYQAFAGGAGHVDVSQIPMQTIHALTYVAWGLIAISLLLAWRVYAAYHLLHEVEHAGWHHRDEMIAEQAHASEAAAATESPERRRWNEILALMDGPSENDWRRAIIEADNLLNEMLMIQGYAGDSLGERLKGANPIQFATLNLAWQAHKVRNDIAHGGMEFHLDARTTRATIELYRRVFEEFNYI